MKNMKNKYLFNEKTFNKRFTEQGSFKVYGTPNDVKDFINQQIEKERDDCIDACFECYSEGWKAGIKGLNQKEVNKL